MPLNKSGTDAASEQPQVETRVTDPVCGMKVDRAKAATLHFAGETYYFCSTHCLHAFEADPDKYVRAAASAEHRHAVHAHH